MMIPACHHVAVVTPAGVGEFVNQAREAEFIGIDDKTAFASGYRFVGHFLIAKIAYCH
jgi:hypothetical protein